MGRGGIFAEIAGAQRASSMISWWPKVRRLAGDIHMPTTAILRTDPVDAFDYLDGDESAQERMHGMVRDELERWKLPVFLRTDLVSNKHDWVSSCVIRDMADVPRMVYGTLEGAAIKDQMVSGVVIREFLALEHHTTAYHGLPIGTEARVFVRDGHVECVHPYWVEEAVEQGVRCSRGSCTDMDGNHIPHNWRDLLHTQHYMVRGAAPILERYGGMVGDVVDGYWSVDFALDVRGEWWLIDMAEGARSYHHTGGC